MRLNNLSMYEIMSDGSVFSYFSNRYLTINPPKDKTIGPRIKLTTDLGECKWFYVSNLVMSAFGPEMPADKPLVLHKDYNFCNNDISNLMWGSQSDRAKLERHRTKVRIPMNVYYHGDYVCTCSSASQASLVTKLSRKVVLKHMRNGTMSVNGYSFEEIK